MPGYTIEKLLGRGGMGAVYRGVQINLDRPVAIKILPPGVEKEDPSFAERFKSEARLMAKLNHPAVVAVYDFGTTLGGQLYFAMEYVDGSDVSQMISAQGRLPAEHALAITAHVCDALGAAHELGIVHRDIKPANVLLNMKGQVKVADFGLAKVEEPGQHGLTKTGYAMGTPDFVAPEALTLGTAIDGRADIYAVGVMLYQMLTGNIPRGAFKPAFVLVPGLDPRYDPIILKAMQHDREERYQTSAELRHDLDVILTVPLVQNNAPLSAAIPVTQVLQVPGQRSAAQKPVAKGTQQRNDAGAAAKKPEAGKGTPAPASPAKSKAPLFIGLGLATALGIGAFVMLGGKKPAADQTSASAQALDSAAPTAALPLSPSTEPWKDMLRDPTQLKLGNNATVTPEGQMRLTGLSTVHFLAQGPKRDGAVRMLATFDPRAADVQLQARRNGNSVYSLTLVTDQRLQLGHWDSEAKKTNILREISLRQPLRSGEDYEMELRAVGQTLTAKFNGKVVTTFTDGIYPDGVFSIGATETKPVLSVVKALELLDLDAAKPAATISSSSPPATTSSTSKLPPGQWVDFPLPDATTLEKSQVTVSGRELNLVGGFKAPNVILKNASVRGELRRIPGNKPMSVTFRLWNPNPPPNAENRHFSIFLADLWLQVAAPENKFTTLQRVPYPSGSGPQEWMPFEFAALGDMSIARIAGKLLPVGRSARAQEPGGVSIYNGQARNLQIMNLDGLSGPEALRLLGMDERDHDTRSTSAPTTASAQFPGSKFPPGQWVKVLTTAEDLSSDLRKPESGVKFEDGWVRGMKVGQTLYLPSDLRANYAVRLRAVRGTSTHNGEGIVVRRHEPSEVAKRGHYFGKYSGGTFLVQHVLDGKYETLHASSPSDAPAVGQEYTMELGVVGNRLFSRLNSERFTVEMKPDFMEGRTYLSLQEPFRDVEVMNLDGLSEAEALKLLGVDEKGNDTRAVTIAKEKQAEEQAKVVEAAISIPELKALHEQLGKLTAERVTAPFEAEVAKLNAGYVGGIDRKITEETAAGHLDGVLALEAEKKLIADKQPIPATDAEGTTANLKGLRDIYRTAYAKIEASRVANLKLLTEPLSLRLKTLETELTKQKRVPDAKTVREYRENLSAAAAVPVPAASAQAPAGNRVANSPPTSKALPIIKKYPKNDDQKAAEWVLRVGGRVTIMEDGKSRKISDAASLPKSRFILAQVFLTFNFGDSPKEPINDLEALAGLEGLYSVEISRLPLRDEQLAPLTQVPGLTSLSLEKTEVTDDCIGYLLQMPKLKKFYPQTNPGFTGSRLAELADLPLADLSLLSTGVTDATVAALPMLKKLTTLHLTNTAVTDEGMMSVGKLTQLSAFHANQYFAKPMNMTFAGLGHLKRCKDMQVLGWKFTTGRVAEEVAQVATWFPNLETVQLSYCKYSAADIAAFAGFRHLTTLRFDGPETEDDALAGVAALNGLKTLHFKGVTSLTNAGLEQIAKHKGLAEIALSEAYEITDEGLMKLATMKQLNKITLSNCRKLTAGGIAAFKKARPEITVIQ